MSGKPSLTLYRRFFFCQGFLSTTGRTSGLFTLKQQTDPYGRIKETTIGGIIMPREYRNICQYEKEIIELWEQGKTL